MKICTVKKVFVMFLVNRIYVGARCFEKKRKLLNSVGYAIGDGTKVVGPMICTGKIVVGKNCWLGRDLKIHGNGEVHIGDNCDIAPEVTFLTGGHEIGTSERRAGAGQIYTIHVENGCWIGACATVGRNITIGKGSAVAACACVMNDIKPNTLVGGVPAKEIRKLDEK